VDDFRPDLKSYGHADAPPTPNLDAFAHTARVFRRAYSQFPDCAPSRSSFLTGLRPDHLGINSHDCTGDQPPPSVKCHIRDNPLGTKLWTLPQFFKETQGYLSLSYGKVFHQGLDDDLSWSPQSEFPDSWPRGHANGSDTWATRKW
jgi:arylsulfatase A-like enzyme